MTKADIRQILITITACVLTAAIILFSEYQSQKKIAVVDAVKLFNGYKMKQELEAKAGLQLQYLAKVADSVKQELAAKSKDGKTPEAALKDIYKSYVDARTTLEQAYQQSNETINEEVWKRLNPAIDEYGRREGLRLIIGANGRGSVLYNDAFYDQTKQVIDFVNNKYEKGY